MGAWKGGGGGGGGATTLSIEQPQKMRLCPSSSFTRHGHPVQQRQRGLAVLLDEHGVEGEADVRDVEPVALQNAQVPQRLPGAPKTVCVWSWSTAANKRSRGLRCIVDGVAYGLRNASPNSVAMHLVLVDSGDIACGDFLVDTQGESGTVWWRRTPIPNAFSTAATIEIERGGGGPSGFSSAAGKPLQLPSAVCSAS